jgi:hypothetical protein
MGVVHEFDPLDERAHCRSPHQMLAARFRCTMTSAHRDLKTPRSTVPSISHGSRCPQIAITSPLAAGTSANDPRLLPDSTLRWRISLDRPLAPADRAHLDLENHVGFARDTCLDRLRRPATMRLDAACSLRDGPSREPRHRNLRRSFPRHAARALALPDSQLEHATHTHVTQAHHHAAPRGAPRPCLPQSEWYRSRLCPWAMPSGHPPHAMDRP